MIQKISERWQQPQRNQPLDARPSASIGQIGGSGDESDSPIPSETLAAIRENAEAALADIDGDELRAISAIEAEYAVRFRDHVAQGERWGRDDRPEAEAVYRQLKTTDDENKILELCERWEQLTAPFLERDREYARINAERSTAIAVIREHARQQRRSVLSLVRKAEAETTSAVSAARIEAERRERIAIKARQAEIEAQRIARAAADKETRRVEAERRATEKAAAKAAQLAQWPTKANRGASGSKSGAGLAGSAA